MKTMLITLAATIALLAIAAIALHREQRLERTVDIAAPPEKVWEALTDFTAYGEWNPFIRELSGTPEAGQKLTARIHPAGGKAMTFTPTVLAAEPGRELRWLGRVFVPRLLDGEHSFVIEPTATGSRLTHAEEFRGVLVPLVGSALDVGDDFDAMNAALKERVEASVSIAR
ncbi:hypothetical protein N802_11140 [Knoellia sinensis KCTC 19936]|uniref:Polyketide cyclase n=1 Tax=Knoellia sinensis KCTC 19936 TaxID=1385520 RepID=A0A0A0J453_9MICO|nr:SRPBCC domain-containing protein [Knoellia sinensis]KGN32130.1 hypothetical protein N802_11140 [Knoellia sinensis KCTC 19936]